MNIYCSGIGGIGLSAYASLMHHDGHTVYGSDRTGTALTDDLQSQGITVFLDQSGSAIPDGIDLFVYSEAIPETAPERIRAKELGIRQISYPHAVGELSKDYTLIAMCGTHGKSSTTAMVARLLTEAGFDPTVIVGTKLKELDGRNWRKGKSKFFVLEACEYRKSFHFYHPTVILMTNCDGDHFDYYTSLDDYHQSFVDFFSQLTEDGIVITHMDDPDCAKVAMKSGKNTMNADVIPLPDVATPGMHMKKNAQLVVGLAEHLGIENKKALDILKGFSGSWRRLEVKGTRADGVTIIDDYGHHPVEIKATLAALKGAYADRRLVCVFQPHTHDRTLKLYDDFIHSFTDVDQLIVTDVYDARHDTEKEFVNAEQFVKDIAEHTKATVTYGGTLANVETLLPSIMKEKDVLLCLGAGDVTNLATKLSK